MTGLPMSPHAAEALQLAQVGRRDILALSALRLLWRLTHRPPADVPMPAWQQRAAHAAHGALYVLFFAVPLAGWAYSSAAGFPRRLVRRAAAARFRSPDRELAEAIKPLHKILAYTLAALVLAHVGGALKHQFVDRDGLLRPHAARPRLNLSNIPSAP
jgi:cytochrome b561